MDSLFELPMDHHQLIYQPASRYCCYRWLGVR